VFNFVFATLYSHRIPIILSPSLHNAVAEPALATSVKTLALISVSFSMHEGRPSFHANNTNDHSFLELAASQSVIKNYVYLMKPSGLKEPTESAWWPCIS